MGKGRVGDFSESTDPGGGFPSGKTVVTTMPTADKPNAERNGAEKSPDVIPIGSAAKLQALRSLSLNAPLDDSEPQVARRAAPRTEKAPSQWLPWTLLILVSGASAGYVGWTHRAKPNVAPTTASGAPRTATVDLMGPTGRTLQAVGYVAARTPIVVGTPTGGQIKKVMVENGSRVTRGQVIAQLNDGALRAEMAVARAKKHSAERLLVRTRRLYEAQAATSADLDRATGEAEVARADLIPIAEKLSQSKILSPVDGTVLEVQAHPGEILVGNAGVAKVADLRDMVAEVDVNEADIPMVHRTQEADLTSDAFPDRVYKGTVSEIAATADRARGTVQVKVDIKSDGSLKPGMSIKANFKPKTNEKSRMLIPRAALDGGAVWVVDATGTLSRRPVKTLDAGGSQIEVTEGLQAGEKIVVENVPGLQAGMKIQ